MILNPKRRKHKDNPYNIIKTEKGYKVRFNDNKNQVHDVEINEELYNLFNQFELDDLRELNEYDRHIEHSNLFESTLYERAVVKYKSLDSLIEEKILKEKLEEVLDMLPNIEYRRIKFYYYHGFTQREIANIEKVSVRAIQYSLNSAIKKLKKFLK